MKKIAIVACLRANDVCAGVSCLSALEERRGHFQRYKGEPVRLCAFLRCSQCGVDPKGHPGMMEKLEHLVSCGVETAHIGVCASRRDGTVCPHVAKTASWLEEKGVHIVWGTHEITQQSPGQQRRQKKLILNEISSCKSDCNLLY